jgi:hypothetical protein
VVLSLCESIPGYLGISICLGIRLRCFPTSPFASYTFRVLLGPQTNQYFSSHSSEFTESLTNEVWSVVDGLVSGKSPKVWNKLY